MAERVISGRLLCRRLAPRIAAAALAACGRVQAEQRTGQAAGPADAARERIVADAADRGVRWLVAQQAADGSFAGTQGRALTGLACLALMSAGHFPGRSAFGDSLRSGVRHLAAASESGKGYIGRGMQKPMYAQGICTLALCEAYGTMDSDDDNRRVHRAAAAALDLIARAQCRAPGNARAGGWRYEPEGQDSDLSVTVWQVFALRSAQGAKLPVSDRVMQAAAGYVRAAFTPKLGGFVYQPGSAQITPATRCEGAVCLVLLNGGRPGRDADAVRESLSFLDTFDPSRGRYFYYQSFHVAAAAVMRGGPVRERLLPAVAQAVMRQQKETGEFRPCEGEEGGVYATSFAVLCLTVGNRLLTVQHE